MSTLEHKRLLVLEDEYMLADDLARALTASGAEVVGPFPTEAAAMRELDRGAPIDGAVLDVNLDGHIGMAVADRLLAERVPFVLATGYGSTAIDERFAEIPHWEKPYDAVELAKALPKKLFL